MVEPLFNFLQIHRKMIFRDAAIIVENVLGKRPKPFDPVDVVLRSAIHEILGMVDGVMFALASPRSIASKRIRVGDGTFAGSGLNVSHEGVRRHVFDHLRIDSSIPLQQPEDHAFAGCAPAPAPLPPSAEIGFVQLDRPRVYWPCLPIRRRGTRPPALSGRPD